jgi:hypothetical protein
MSWFHIDIFPLTFFFLGQNNTFSYYDACPLHNGNCSECIVFNCLFCSNSSKCSKSRDTQDCECLFVFSLSSSLFVFLYIYDFLDKFTPFLYLQQVVPHPVSTTWLIAQECNQHQRQTLFNNNLRLAVQSPLIHQIMKWAPSTNLWLLVSQLLSVFSLLVLLLCSFSFIFVGTDFFLSLCFLLITIAHTRTTNSKTKKHPHKTMFMFVSSNDYWFTVCLLYRQRRKQEIREEELLRTHTSVRRSRYGLPHGGSILSVTKEWTPPSNST